MKTTLDLFYIYFRHFSKIERYIMDLFMKIKTLNVPASEKGAFVDVQS